MDISDGLSFFYPDYRGNLSLPKKERIKVWFEPVPFRYVNNINSKNGKKNEAKIQEKMFLKFTDRIENFSIAGEKLETPEELYMHPKAPTQLIARIIEALEERSDEDAEEFEKTAGE